MQLVNLSPRLQSLSPQMFQPLQPACCINCWWSAASSRQQKSCSAPLIRSSASTSSFGTSGLCWWDTSPWHLWTTNHWHVQGQEDKLFWVHHGSMVWCLHAALWLLWIIAGAVHLGLDHSAMAAAQAADSCFQDGCQGAGIRGCAPPSFATFPHLTPQLFTTTGLRWRVFDVSHGLSYRGRKPYCNPSNSLNSSYCWTDWSTAES